jgi:hypothetical protein
VDPFLTMEVLYQLSYEGALTERIGSEPEVATTRYRALARGPAPAHGGGRIRTCEGRANAFTARPL